MVNAGRRRCAVSVPAALAAAMVLAAVAGCAGPGGPGAGPQRYTESISSVLLSEDGRHMAAIGSSHHYIFEAPPVLFQALHSPIHASLTATFSTFHVDRRNVVTGDYTLSLPAGVAADQQRAAAAIGFTRSASGAWETAGTITGQRFAGWTYRGGREQDRLNRPYTIAFTTDFSAADTAVDGAATPIRTAADGVQLLYYAPLAPVVIPFIFLMKANDH